MKLADLATYNVISIGPADTLDHAIALMERHGIHHLPVVGEKGVEGILSDRDLLVSVGWLRSGDRRLQSDRTDLAGPARVGDIMTRSVVTMSPGETISHAANKMIECRISAIVLVRDGHVLGIITKLDLLRYIYNLEDRRGTWQGLRESVRHHMRVHVVTLGPDDTLLSASSLMRDHGIRHIPIVAGEVVIGIVSDRDLRRACGIELIQDECAEQRGELYVAESALSEIMSNKVRSIDPDDTVRKALDEMVGHRIGALPVVEGEKLVGIITDTDLVRLLGH